MLNLSKRNMLLPISENLCYLNFNHEASTELSCYAVFFWRNMLLPISVNLCCFDSDHEVYNWFWCPIQVLKELLNKPPCVCIIRCILDGKVNRFSQEIFSGQETLRNFSIHITPFFWVVSINTFVDDISVPCNLWNNLYHCYLIQFFFWLVTKIAINFSN